MDFYVDTHTLRGVEWTSPFNEVKQTIRAKALLQEQDFLKARRPWIFQFK